jgi:hypothetical protein
MRHERNAGLCDGFNMGNMTSAAFELYRFGARID